MKTEYSIKKIENQWVEKSHASVKATRYE